MKRRIHRKMKHSELTEISTLLDGRLEAVNISSRLDTVTLEVQADLLGYPSVRLHCLQVSSVGLENIRTGLPDLYHGIDDVAVLFPQDMSGEQGLIIELKLGGRLSESSGTIRIVCIEAILTEVGGR